MAIEADVPPVAYMVALAGLPRMGPIRFRAVMARWPAAEAWRMVQSGRAVLDPGVAAACRPDPAGVASAWRRQADALDVGAVWGAHVSTGISVLTDGDPGWPPSFVADPEPPAVLFVDGALAPALALPRVAVVGTRRCSHDGRAVAREFGRDLAAAGVSVISGLALGIDGAAHGGALEAGGAPPVAVVAGGLDIVYPRRHAELWRRVATSGAVLSEAPLGTPPEPWRFPARNRLIAALADVVVVVESASTGGSMHTVAAALDRDRPVMAVPGPVRSRMSVGTNALLADGAPPARDAADVLVALGLDVDGASSPRPIDLRSPPDPSGRTVLDAVGWQPTTVDEIADRVGAPLGPVAVQLTRLEQQRWVRQERGRWARVP